MRMGISKEGEKMDMTSKEIQEDLEIDAKTRQIYDPCKNIYDSRKRRVTDLQECTRVREK